MRSIIIIILFVFFTHFITAQISGPVYELNFPITLVGNNSVRSLSLINDSPIEKQYKLVLNSNMQFTVEDTLLNLPIGTQVNTNFIFKPKQNIIEEGLLVYQTEDSSEVIVIKLKGSGNYGDIYDATTFNLFDTQLKQALTNYVSNHTVLGYNSARDKMFMEFDNKKVNGGGATQNTLECVYTGRLAVGYTSRTDAQNNYDFNTEHTWPQGQFGSADPMVSDLFHLFPTDNTANSIRGNYPFGVVVSGVNWMVGNSKRGNSWNGNIVFEPRDAHKGNVARGMLYFQLRYPQNYGGYLDTAQENIFRKWNILDTVDAAERYRNNAIALLQGKRNPLIDHPEFVNRIFSFRSNTNRTKSALFSAFPQRGIVDSTFIGDTTSFELNLLNTGNATLNINSVSSSDNRFVFELIPDSISSTSSEKLKVLFIPDSSIDYTTQIVFQTSVGNYSYSLEGVGVEKPLSSESEGAVISSFYLAQNYPNPFNPLTIITYSIPKSGIVNLKVFDVIGNEVITLVDGHQEAGKHNITFNLNNKKNILPSGLYIYSLTANGNKISKKMILLK
jgi:endonuclease I